MKKDSIESVQHELRLFEPDDSFREKAFVRSRAEYRALHEKSLRDPDMFWREAAGNYFWHKDFSAVLKGDFSGDVCIRYFDDGKTNICHNAVDRHLALRANKTALLYIANDGLSARISYADLHQRVSRFANVLKNQGLKKGDRVGIYMPMIPEATIAMLACARLGLVHNVVFGGFSAQSLAGRLHDSQARCLITANELLRGDKIISLKNIADEAMTLSQQDGHTIESCIVFKRTKTACAMHEGRDFFWDVLEKSASAECPVEWQDAEDPLFILYTSGSTGKPKGVLHTTAGYMVYVGETTKYVFDLHDDDIYFCTADVGWITGHSYLVYGPLLNGATTVIYEGIPTWPAPDRLWEIIAKEKVTILYTSPTAIRSLMREGETWPKKHDLTSLRLLGSVGEPINPEAWLWYHKNIGGGQCPIVDTWWQTETGGIVLSPLPGAIACKPGAATVPFFGIQAAILREDGSLCDINEGGNLVIEKPWPGMMRTVYGNHERFRETYFSRYPGKYFSGDGAHTDEDGDYWLLGRIDDIIKVSGHRLGTAEIESALVAHPAVAEAAVVGFPHTIKGQGIYAFVTLKAGIADSADLNHELSEHVKKQIGAIAKPEFIQFTEALPKTRSGKIMRRILRKIAAGEKEGFGDTSTLADPLVVEKLLSKTNS